MCRAAILATTLILALTIPFLVGFGIDDLVRGLQVRDSLSLADFGVHTAARALRPVVEHDGARCRVQYNLTTAETRCVTDTHIFLNGTERTTVQTQRCLNTSHIGACETDCANIRGLAEGAWLQVAHRPGRPECSVVPAWTNRRFDGMETACYEDWRKLIRYGTGLLATAGGLALVSACISMCTCCSCACGTARRRDRVTPTAAIPDFNAPPTPAPVVVVQKHEDEPTPPVVPPTPVVAHAAPAKPVVPPTPVVAHAPLANPAVLELDGRQTVRHEITIRVAQPQGAPLYRPLTPLEHHFAILAHLRDHNARFRQ